MVLDNENSEIKLNVFCKRIDFTSHPEINFLYYSTEIFSAPSKKPQQFTQYMTGKSLCNEVANVLDRNIFFKYHNEGIIHQMHLNSISLRAKSFWKVIANMLA